MGKTESRVGKEKVCVEKKERTQRDPETEPDGTSSKRLYKCFLR